MANKPIKQVFPRARVLVIMRVYYIKLVYADTLIFHSKYVAVEG